MDGTTVRGAALVDLSSSSNSGTLVSSPTLRPGRIGQALSFNGSTQSVTVAKAFANTYGTVTYAFWVYIPSASMTGAMLDDSWTGDGGGGEIAGMGIVLGNGDGNTPGNHLLIPLWGVSWQDTGVNIGTGWHHIGVILQSSKTNAFIDGRKIFTGSTNIAGPGVGALVLGAAGVNVAFDYHLNGYMDDVRVWNRALSPSEVMRLYSDTSGSLGLIVPRRRIVGVTSSTIAAAIAESATAADTISATGFAQVAVAESGTAADTIALTARPALTIAEAGTAADNETLTAQIVASEAGTAADTISIAVALPITVSEAGTATDAESLAALIRASETGSALDTIALGGTLGIAVAESGTATDTAAATAIITIAVAESGTAADTVAATLGGTIAVAIAEAATALDTVAATATMGVAVSETGAATDTVTATVNGVFAVSITEAGTATDAVAVGSSRFAIAVAESPIIADRFTFVAPLPRPSIPVPPRQFGSPAPNVVNMAATGTTPGTAALIYARHTVFTTVEHGAYAQLPQANSPLDAVMVLPRGGNDLNVIPGSGGQIENLGTEAAVTVPDGGGALFVSYDPTRQTVTGRQWWLKQ